MSCYYLPNSTKTALQTPFAANGIKWQMDMDMVACLFVSAVAVGIGPEACSPFPFVYFD